MRHEDVFAHLDYCSGSGGDGDDTTVGGPSTSSTPPPANDDDALVRCPACDAACKLSALNAHLDAGCPPPMPSSGASSDAQAATEIGTAAAMGDHDKAAITSARLDKLAEQLTCSICCDTFENPHSLPCQHSFCYDCVVGCFKVTATMQCPLCKQPMWMRQVTPNHVLAGIVSAFREAVAESS